ncbi:elongation factor Ts [Treponema phagedenis]|uniref:Elongation factor Ts n=1 Tax=Treponema phagedenis TaxID=162 RepID=A0A0B7GS02_TREPH|nr:translation elongation factor Ts [Treponema phagedenis]EFW39225.1 translation elongation factor Ts [Treponema phagedenis F0421]NVP23555.1 elongation factor Ts [Treponema phagedenis]QEJ94564.1 elongation factor Ts [Treponema phagedenis]QEJ98689.1 elongation factor Ts [Treponema phagedenis]QEK01558.1 elongation factor Ts [Treponema phagedenis]
MDIKAADVKALREKTGAGMMECKKALQACNGDAHEAEKYLKEKGLAAVEKRADRATSEGIIVIKHDAKKAAMVELTCETDFVAKNADFIAVGEDIANTAFTNELTEVTPELNDKILDLATRVRENMTLSRVTLVKAAADEYISTYVHFDKKSGVIAVLKADKPEIFSNEDVQTFAHDCCLHAVAFPSLYIKPEDVDQTYIDEQLEIFNGQVAELDKPEKVKTGIVQGKLKKHLAEICFLEQPFVKDDKVSVAKKMEEIGKQAGAKLSLSKLIIYHLGVK